jgi:transposase
MVDFTGVQHGQVHARLLDLVPGRSGQAYRTWLVERVRSSVPASRSPPSTRSTATKNAVDDQLEDAVAVPDAFHVAKLATSVVDHVGRRVRQETTGPRGRRDDPLYRVQNILRAGQEQ